MRCSRSATASCRRPRTSSSSATTSTLDVVAGEPRAIGRRPALSNSFGFGGHNATLDPRSRRRDRHRQCPRCHAPIRARRRSWRSERCGRARGELATSSTVAPSAGSASTGGKHRGAIGVGRGRGDGTRGAARRSSSASRSSARVDTSGADVGEGVAVAARVGPRRPGAGRRVGRRSRRCSPSSDRASRARRSCSACVDQVVMTDDAFAYVTGPDTVTAFTGRGRRSGRARRRRTSTTRRSGVAALVVDDEAEALRRARGDPRLPPRQPPRRPARAPDCDDPVDRRLRPSPPGRCRRRADRVVRRARRDRRRRRRTTASSSCAPRYAPNLVTGLARLDGRPVGVVANQPLHRAGTLDIEASRQGRAVRRSGATPSTCRSSRSSTRPGFEPGSDLEWRGMIRHGAAARARVRRGDRAPPVRRAAQGVRRRVHRHGLRRASATTGAARGRAPRSR